MSWMITRHGQEHHLSGHEALANRIDIADIACSLAQTNRFNGHCIRPYSVAEHSLLVAGLAEREGKSALVQLACLLHDAHEAYTGDQSTPAKQAIGLSWTAFEARQCDLVRRAMGLLVAFQAYRDLIHHFDLVALATEREQLTTWDASKHQPWPVIDTPGREVPPAAGVVLNSFERSNRPWTQWRDIFLARYFALAGVVQSFSNTEIAA